MAIFNILNGYITDIRGSRYLLIGDIERCPYVPSEPEYDNWNEKDIKRCQELVEARSNLHKQLNQYLSHPDFNVRQMAIFLDWFWGEK